MGQIRVMPPELANQIAAGEVVERPASCVKELVENSLDAGARQIRVALEQGGIARIVVSDDGSGMDPEDAVLAFARHATSKVRHARDLFRITTLGFRGEALASIAAVARVTLQTRPRDAEQGVAVRVEGSRQAGLPEPVGMPPGTRIEVRDLFFNTPARLKYLKSVATEQARAVEVVQRAAMARPDVGFVCEADGRLMFRTGGRGDLLEVLAVLWGVSEAEQLLRVEAATADYRVTGYIGRPSQSKSSRAYGHLFVNGRPIRNLGLHQAVMNAYGNRLMLHRHPVYALHIELDPSLIDVNIHPHKAEVRFSEERDVADLVRRAVAKALEGATLIPDARMGRSGAGGRDRLAQDTTAESEVARTARQQVLFSPASSRWSPTARAALDRALTPVQGPTAADGAGAGTNTPSAPSLSGTSPAVPVVTSHTPQHTDAGDKAAAALEPADLVRDSAKAEGPGPVGVVRERLSDDGDVHAGYSAMGADSSHDGPCDDAHAQAAVLPPLRLVGQVLGTYVVAEAADAVYLIDQHAAHERVLYERFNERLRQRDVRPMPLITGLTFRLLPQERSALERCREELAACGLEVEDFGGSDVLVRTVPDIWEGLDIPALVEGLLRELPDVTGKRDPRDALHEWLALRACKAAVKAGMRMTEPELEALLQALAETRDPFHCPHGRPVFIRLTRRELDVEFRRIV